MVQLLASKHCFHVEVYISIISIEVQARYMENKTSYNIIHDLRYN